MNMHFPSRGYTLIETIISVTIFSVLSIMVAGSIVFLYRTHSQSIQQAFALASARKGIDLMVRDIREAAFSDDGAFPVVGIGAHEFIFYSDTDRDDNVERIRYFVEGTDLKRGVVDPTGSPPVYTVGNEVVSIVSDNVRNAEQSVALFRYYDDSGTEIVDAADILDVSFVTLNVIVNVDPNRLPGEFTLYSSATIRNLKTNL